MPKTVADLYREALALSEEERNQLLRLLTGRPADRSPGSGIEKSWIDECKRRLEELDGGAVKAIPADAVLREARERLGR